MIAVTGATGFVGTELVQQLTAKGYSVRALKRGTSVIPALLKGNPLVQWTEADMLDSASLEDAFEGAEQVYHCAAFISFHPADRKALIRNNVTGAANVVNACLEKNVKKLLHVSSVAALGEPRFGQAITEQNFWEYTGRQSAYSISKHESEMEAWRGMAEGLDVVIVNPSLIFGHNSGTAGTGQMIGLVRKGLNYYTDGGSGLVDVEDVAGAMIALMESEASGERFILNAGNMSYRELFGHIARHCGKQAPQKSASRWMLNLAAMFQKTRALLGGAPASLTAETINSAFKNSRFDSRKVQQLLNFSFKPAEQVLADACL